MSKFFFEGYGIVRLQGITTIGRYQVHETEFTSIPILSLDWEKTNPIVLGHTAGNFLVERVIDRWSPTLANLLSMKMSVFRGNIVTKLQTPYANHKVIDMFGVTVNWVRAGKSKDIERVSLRAENYSQRYMEVD